MKKLVIKSGKGSAYLSSEMARIIQLAFFTTAGGSLNSEELFAAAFDRSPDNVHKHLKPLGPQQILGRAEGLSSPFMYQVLVQAGRIDFIIAPRPGDGLPLLDGASNAASELVTQVLDRLAFDNVTRIALVIDYAEPAGNVTDANARLRDRLGEDVPTEDTLDFILQINRRRKSSISGEVNRLIKWSVETLQQFSFQAPAAAGPVTIELNPEDAISTTYLTSHMVDINTVPVREPIPVERQRKHLEELLQESLWLRRHGTPRKWSDNE